MCACTSFPFLALDYIVFYLDYCVAFSIFLWVVSWHCVPPGRRRDIHGISCVSHTTLLRQSTDGWSAPPSVRRGGRGAIGPMPGNTRSCDRVASSPDRRGDRWERPSPAPSASAPPERRGGRCRSFPSPSVASPRASATRTAPTPARTRSRRRCSCARAARPW